MSELVAFDERRIALAFSDYLRTVGISNRVEARSDRFAVVLKDPLQLPRAQTELEAFVANPADSKYWQASWEAGHVQHDPVYKSAPDRVASWRVFLASAGPVTLGITVLCIGLWLLVRASGEQGVRLFLFPEALTAAAIGSEWWRLLSPAFLHWFMLHILFNLLWWWNLGGIIERTQSSGQLLALTLVIALTSNVAQFLSYGPAFMGLSAVVYGLLGYIWLYPKANPAVGFRLRKEIVYFMVGWLALGYTGLLDGLIGPISNNGHLAGLVIGGVLGLAFGLLNRGQPGKPLA